MNREEKIVNIALGEMLTQRRAGKRDWMIQAARLAFNPSPKRSCTICGKFRNIAHAHHVVPLAAQFERQYEKPDHDHVWLCPTHHALMHVLIGPEGDFAPTEEDYRKHGAASAGLILELSEGELRIALGLLARAGVGRR
jgi:hypothetical protein